MQAGPGHLINDYLLRDSARNLAFYITLTTGAMGHILCSKLLLLILLGC